MKDIIIIGGGPAGLTAALYASRAGADVTIIESGAPGGKLNLTAHIENYPGIKEMMGPQLAYDMYEQALNFGAQLKMTEVKSIVDEGDYKKVITSKEELEARVVIIATGTKERKMGLHLEDEMTGKGISYCAVCDGPFFRGKEVAVIGGGNSAIEESIYLAGITEKVHIIMRRDVFRADDYLVKKALIIIGEVVALFFVALYVGLPLASLVTGLISYHDKEVEFLIIFLIILFGILILNKLNKE